MTQQELSEHMGVGQKRISALENGHFEMLKIDTLKRYIAGLGGTLEITANLPGKRIRML